MTATQRESTTTGAATKEEENGKEESHEQPEYLSQNGRSLSCGVSVRGNAEIEERRAAETAAKTREQPSCQHTRSEDPDNV